MRSERLFRSSYLWVWYSASHDEQRLVEQRTAHLGRVNLKLLRRTDWELLDRSQIRYEQLLHRLHIDETSLFAPTLNTASVPADARDYLRPENPRLRGTSRRYRDLDHPVLKHSLWTDDSVGRQVDLQLFRGDLAYVYQFLDLNIEVNYFVTFQYLKALDELRIFDRITEDSLFGANTLSIGVQPSAETCWILSMRSTFSNGLSGSHRAPISMSST